MDEKINAAREALAALNRALSDLVSDGIEAEISTIDTTLINDPATRTTITIHLTKLRKEIDVHL